MPKRILLAEESDTIRKIAESLLRQNGFEVLSMNSGVKALEVLKFTSPDLILLASDMVFKGETFLFQKLQSDPKTAQLPIVLLANEEENNLPFQSEAIIRKPFNPKEFIDKVNMFTGQSTSAQANPLAVSDVEDDFLDAALGLDQLDVTDSEVLGNATTGKIKKVQSVEKMIGFDHKQDTSKITSDSTKIESLMIPEDATDIRHSKNVQPATLKEPSHTGKIEILDDQFGIVNQESSLDSKEDAEHDYNWFLDELTNDNMDADKVTPQDQEESQSLKFEETSTFVDPITPSHIEQPQKDITSVDKFIDEFKKEVEKFSSDEPESITLSEPNKVSDESRPDLQWADTVEKITPQQIELFKKDFVQSLADKLAVKIAAKIDTDKLLHLLKQEIINKAKNS